jgi:hypothetical protein
MAHGYVAQREENGLYGKSGRACLLYWDAAGSDDGKKGPRSLHLKRRKQSLSTGSRCKFMQPFLPLQKALCVCWRLHYFPTLFLRMEQAIGSLVSVLSYLQFEQKN